jgi:thioesterase domain-containing protein/acyl carrier protein
MLQHLQQNEQNIGLLSSGYSSETGNDLPSAIRINQILSSNNEKIGPSYFCIGGLISDEQLVSEGMKEDLIHMKGPAELVKDDIRNFLPDYMMPNRIIVMDKIPLTANGKIDNKALKASDKVNLEMDDRPIVEPTTDTEYTVSKMWKEAMKWDSVSVKDNFFQSGGNSLIAVSLINRINREFELDLPLNALFEAPTIEELASLIDSDELQLSSRLVRLSSEGLKNPIYCWPGLGGYPMNLGLLADQINLERPFYGVQAHGINQGEEPFSSISEMAAEDIKEIKRIQPVGPYTIWGYSFGARVAFEVAHQFEQSGQEVENLFLIAPGSPKVKVANETVDNQEANFNNKTYVAILFSVFARSITGPALKECFKVSKDEDSFASFIARYKKLDLELVKRIVKIVHLTYEAKYTFAELEERQVIAPITIFKADGDDYSFIESHSGYSQKPPTVVELPVDHYDLLKTTGVCDLVKAIKRKLNK